MQLVDFPERPVFGWLSCNNNHPEQCNSMGFRGQEITYTDNDFVIVLLGDSEAYALGIPFDHIPERRLEHFMQKYKKNVKVFSIADMGYGQDQQYLALKKYFERFRADLVLLMFTARNDFENNLSPTAGKNNTIKPTFWLEDNELRGPTERWLEPAGPYLKIFLLWKFYRGEYNGEARNKMWEENIVPPKSQKSERLKYAIKLTRQILFKIKKLAEANNGYFIIFMEERNNYTRFMKQYQENLKATFRDFDHYRIPLMIDNFQMSPSDSHLSEEAINIMMEELSHIISKKKYFRNQ